MVEHKLEVAAEIYLGETVCKFIRIEIPPTNRNCILYCTLSVAMLVTYEGTIGYFYVIEDQVYSKLHYLQDLVEDVLPTKGGVLTKTYRWYRCRGTAQRPLKKGIIDVRSIQNYRGLTEHLKVLIARATAGTKEHILNRFRECLPNYA